MWSASTFRLGLSRSAQEAPARRHGSGSARRGRSRSCWYMPLQHAEMRSRPMPVSTEGLGSDDHAGLVAVELHEDVVPDLDVAVAVPSGDPGGHPRLSGPWS